MIVIYGVIGLWAILDPIIIAQELDYPSLLNIVGLAVTAPIGSVSYTHLRAHET